MEKKQNTTQSQEKPKEQKLIAFEKTLSDSVQNRITELSGSGRLDLPKNYSVGNALQSAWLKILATKDKNGRPALEVCTKESVANALLDMAILGHNPAKNHGYFIVYGNQLTWFPSYFGKCATIKRLDSIGYEPVATIIYDGDEVEIGHNSLGEEYVISHKTSWENKLKGIRLGAYATVKQNDIIRSAIMTKDEIKEAWNKNPGQKRDHADFEGEFMKRTVINRLVKMILQTSNDDDLLAETMIANEYQHYDFDGEAEVIAQNEVKQLANTGEVVDIPLEAIEPEIIVPEQQIANEFAEEPQPEPVKPKATRSRPF